MAELNPPSHHTSIQADLVEMRQDFRTMKRNFFRLVRVLNELDIEINTGLCDLSADLRNRNLEDSLNRASKADVSIDFSARIKSFNSYKWIQLTESLFNEVDEAAEAVRDVRSILDRALQACKESVQEKSEGGSL